MRDKLTIDLSGNNLLCSCETLDFLRWMEFHANREMLVFRNFRNYFCSFANSSRANFSVLQNMVAQLEKQCESFIWLITLTTMSITIIIAFVVVGIAYRLRWRIRYFYYMAKRGYRRNVHARNQLDEDYRKMFRYDAFISYANEDRHFALHEMKQQVEDKTDLKMCFHQRDFMPGYDISENIANAIHESRRVVCVISENFLKSHWCMYEFNMALMERIHAREGDDMLFLVLMKDFNSSRAPLSMIQFIRQNCYLEQPDDEAFEQFFWEKNDCSDQIIHVFNIG